MSLSVTLIQGGVCPYRPDRTFQYTPNSKPDLVILVIPEIIVVAPICCIPPADWA
jgi:hypothetical protein